MRGKFDIRLRQAWLFMSLAIGLPTTAGLVHAQTSSEPLRVYAAGSLRGPLTEIAQAFEQEFASPVALTFGASGLLRERLEKGELAQVFASADTQHPASLAAANKLWRTPTRFVRNKLCAILSPAAELLRTTQPDLLSLLLDPAVKLGTSTPVADPAGDYALALFRRAEAVQPGAYAALAAKALQLTGSAAAPQPPVGRGAYSWLMDTGQADVFLTYCTNAAVVARELPRMSVLAIPPALEVAADYGVTARADDPHAERFIERLLSPAAQATFERYGFGAP